MRSNRMLIKTRQVQPRANSPHARASGLGFTGRMFSWGARVAVFAWTFALSVFLVAVATAGMMLLGVYLWWTTRELRRQLRAMMQEPQVIEGEVIRESAAHPLVLRNIERATQRPS